MIKLLSRIFIKKSDTSNPDVRRKYGILCGIVGIFLNVLLFVAKLAAGILSGSVAIMADAFNNLSDAGSSLVTLVGFKLSGQKPDSDHPFGHGRFEYISGFIVSVLIILVGVELGKNSIEKLISPEPATYGIASLSILAVSILVKAYMTYYNKSIGKKIDSAAMEATGTDSLNDCITTAAVLACSIIAHFTSIDLDGWCGLAVAIFILCSGLGAAKDTISPLLGQAPDKDFVDKIKRIVTSHDEVLGIHDLIVHNYGPGRMMISLHAEVDASDDILAAHDAIDNIEHELSRELGCDAVIHMDPIVTDDKISNDVHTKILARIKEIDERISIHDFRMVSGPTHANLIFDVLVPFELEMSDETVKKKVTDAVKDLDPTYNAVIKIDRPYVS